MQCYYLLAFLFINPSLFSFPVLTISYCAVSGEFFSLHFLVIIKSVVSTERAFNIFWKLATYFTIQMLFFVKKTYIYITQRETK